MVATEFWLFETNNKNSIANHCNSSEYYHMGLFTLHEAGLKFQM